MVYVLVNFKESIVEVIGVFIMVLGSRIKYILEKFKIDIWFVGKFVGVIWKM